MDKTVINKFRVWSISKKQYIYSRECPLGLGVELEDKNVIFEQSTGMKDKNGTEIYEGDILDFDEINISGPVEYNNKVGSFLVNKYSLNRKHDLLNTCDCTIIGNSRINIEVVTK